MRVDEIMTREVVSVSPETSLKEVARLLSEHRISGVPVCRAHGRVVGVVSEADILEKEGIGGDHGGGLLAWLFERDDWRTKVAARTAQEAMTSPAVTARPSTSVFEAARLMIDRKINRLPVVEGEALVGIVTRADLVRAFHRSDEEILREISEDVLLKALWISPERLAITVEAGVVSLGGEVETRTQSELVVAYVRRVLGVVDVQADLTWTVDDLARRTRTARIPTRL